MEDKVLLRISLTLNLILILFMFVGGVLWADTNGVWEYAKDIRAGTFGSDEGGGNYAFPNNLNVTGNLVVKNNVLVNGNVTTNKLCINNKCYSNWKDICQTWIEKGQIN